MKTYVITLSQTFPATHPKKGRRTQFKFKFYKGIGKVEDAVTDIAGEPKKIHTIRANYPLWKKRFEQIERGEACLSVRQWSGKPYCSKQIELARLTKEDGIGIQRLDLDFVTIGIRINHETYPLGTELDLAHNDGLFYPDWLDWFRKYDHTKPLAIIHFTKFRYFKPKY